MHNRGEIDAPIVILGALYLNVGTNNWASLQVYKGTKGEKKDEKKDYGQGHK